MAAMPTDAQHAFLDHVLETIRRHDLLPRLESASQPLEPVVVGVSGGPDSVALACVLHGFALQRKLAVAPVVAHLHHGLRERTADTDQVFVENLAARLGLPCEVGRADTRAKAETQGVGVEEAARNARRAFLADVAQRRGAKKVALAHHASDRVETVLFHILRGTGIEGLATLRPRAPLMPEEGIEIVRPLIDVSRTQVLAFLEATGRDWHEDETNTSHAYTRNRLRHKLLPLLRQDFNPKADDALVRLSDQATAASDVLADVLDDVWRQIVRETPVTGASEPDAGASGHRLARRVSRPAASAKPQPRDGSGEPPRSIMIDADDFEPLRPWLQGAIVRRAIEHLGAGLKHMSAERTREVVAALLSKTVAGPVLLPGGLVAARRRRAIRIGRKTNTPPAP